MKCCNITAYVWNWVVYATWPLPVAIVSEIIQRRFYIIERFLLFWERGLVF